MSVAVKRRRFVFDGQQNNTTEAVASEILRVRQLPLPVVDPPSTLVASTAATRPTLSQLALTLKLCTYVESATNSRFCDVPYDRIHSSRDADDALRQLLGMHELARRRHGERLSPAVYADISYSLHVQCGHPFRRPDRVRFKVNNIKKRNLQSVLVRFIL